MTRIGPYKITGSGRCWFIRRVHENGAESPIGFRQRKRDAVEWCRKQISRPHVGHGG